MTTQVAEEAAPRGWRFVLQGGTVLAITVQASDPDAQGVIVLVPCPVEGGAVREVERWAPTLAEALAQAELFAYAIYHRLVVGVLEPGQATPAEVLAERDEARRQRDDLARLAQAFLLARRDYDAVCASLEDTPYWLARLDAAGKTLAQTEVDLFLLIRASLGPGAETPREPQGPTQ